MLATPVADTSALTRLNKTVQSLLNKMTKEKFSKLSKQICDIKMESYDMLNLVICKVFEKAIDEPSFGDMYASLCVEVRAARSKRQGKGSKDRLVRRNKRNPY